jgi:hypothetical protein
MATAERIDLDFELDAAAAGEITCPECGEIVEADLLVGLNAVDFMFCCELAQSRFLDCGESIEEIYGAGLAEILESSTGLQAREVCYEELEPVDTIARFKLEVCQLQFKGSRKLVQDAIRAHHRHNKPPVGDKARFAVYNGPTIVGVAMVGRPVARLYAQNNPGALEITRVCTWGDSRLRRNACSMLYSAAAKWARKAGHDKLISYTLETELGTTLTAAGWVVEAERCGGGSWNRAGRARVDSAPTCPKVRWALDLSKKRRPAAKPQLELPFPRGARKAKRAPAAAPARAVETPAEKAPSSAPSGAQETSSARTDNRAPQEGGPSERNTGGEDERRAAHGSGTRDRAGGPRPPLRLGALPGEGRRALRSAGPPLLRGSVLRPPRGRPGRPPPRRRERAHRRSHPGRLLVLRPRPVI